MLGTGAVHAAASFVSGTPHSRCYHRLRSSSPRPRARHLASCGLSGGLCSLGRCCCRHSFCYCPHGTSATRMESGARDLNWRCWAHWNAAAPASPSLGSGRLRGPICCRPPSAPPLRRCIIACGLTASSTPRRRSVMRLAFQAHRYSVGCTRNLWAAAASRRCIGRRPMMEPPSPLRCCTPA